MRCSLTRSITRCLMPPLTLLALPALAQAADLPRAEPATVGMSAERLGRNGKGIQHHQNDQKIAGAVTLVARRGKVVHYEAHGLMDAEAKTPMRRDSLFRMASSSKPVTGAAVLMLIEEGKVALTDPVSKFIPEFKRVQVAEAEGENIKLVPAKRPVTIPG